MFRLFLQISLDSNIQNLIPAVRKNNSIGHSLSLSHTHTHTHSFSLSHSFFLFLIIFYIASRILCPYNNLEDVVFFKKMGKPQLLLRLFSVFSNKQNIFSANQCEKCLFSLWRRDLDPRLLQHESSPKTTRPGLMFVKIGI